MVPDTTISNPVIYKPTTLGSYKAVINEGRGEHCPPEYINPINTRTIKKTINIDSRFRNAYYNSKSSDFYLDLPETYKKVVKMNLIAYEIPLTIYGINNSNNHFYIKNDDGSSNRIDISSGNYYTNLGNKPLSDIADSSDNIINAINNSLSLLNITYDIDPVTGCSVFSSDNGSSFNIYFNKDNNENYDPNTPLPFKLGWLLGFRAGEYQSDSNHQIKSEGIVNLDVPKYLFLSINDFTYSSNNNFTAIFNDSTLSENIIARIDYRHHVLDHGFYNSASDDEIINYNRSYFGPVDIKKLHIKVLDEYGRVVDFNNMDWSFIIDLDILYE